MKIFNQDEYLKMTTGAKARYLLSFRITAKIEINDELTPVYYAFAGEIRLDGAGEFNTEEDAIAKGIDWLKDIECKSAISENAANNA